MSENSDIILSVKDLVTVFDTETGVLRAVDGVGFELKRGGSLGVVGESGCGKSVTALSIMRLLPKPAGKCLNGEIRFDGLDILSLPPERLHHIRGNRISMIFQEPMTALNPVQTVGKQLGEVFALHQPEMTEPDIFGASMDILEKVGIPDPGSRIGEYPHQISGGMRQRVMIAMALACKPDILIADEPTTALDVTIQAQILDLIHNLQQETGMSVIFITHDLGVIAQICDDVVVMYAGKVVESAPVHSLFKTPGHPYTRGLLSSIPRLESRPKSRLNIIRGMVPALDELPPGCRFQNRCPEKLPVCESRAPDMIEVGKKHFSACHLNKEPRSEKWSGAVETGREEDLGDASEASDVCLTVKGLKMHFPVRGGVLRRRKGSVFAVDGVSFRIESGKTLGLVGESGCGKTTVGRCILKLYKPTSGEVLFEKKNVLKLSSDALRALRRNMQMIFQDPFESLNSRHTIGEILEEPFVIHGMGAREERAGEVIKLLGRVGLPESAVTRFPHEFSGGQRQRIGIARAIALKPRLIVCDEPVSALDVSIQSQILNLLLELQREMGLAYLFIAHDLAVVKHVADRIAVMYLGKIVEYTDADAIYTNPIHPYTRALISAIPVPDPAVKGRRQILQGDVPSPINPPPGCVFHTRCPHVHPRCKTEIPELLPAPGPAGASHLHACLRAEELAEGGDC
ncbi:MAG: ABC transporter ATP-binding protein [Desulfobacterales bacterium]|nr:ABC transporter ATP-binding protein [Desulfobacterales bacterium]